MGHRLDKNWGADFADPFTMINEQFDPSAADNFGHFNEPAFTRRMRQEPSSAGIDASGPTPAGRDLTQNDPPGAAWGNGTVREFFSTRVGCQTYQPVWGTDLGSLCLRR